MQFIVKIINIHTNLCFFQINKILFIKMFLTQFISYNKMHIHKYFKRKQLNAYSFSFSSMCDKIINGYFNFLAILQSL